MGVLFHHTCIIPFPSSNSCHNFYHPWFSCCLHLSPHCLYWHVPMKMRILCIIEFLVHLSCCICPVYVGFEDGTWGIEYFQWWIRSVYPPSICCDDCQFVLLARRKGSALLSMCIWILSAISCMSQNPMNVTLVPHIPENLYIVGSLQWTQRHQPLCWSAHTTVYWSLILGEMCRQ